MSTLSKAMLIALAVVAATPALAGLSPDFGRQLVIAAIVIVAIYAIYPAILIAAIIQWRKGRRAIAGALIGVTLVGGFVFPLVHQQLYKAELGRVRAASILPETLDLSDKTVLVVTSSSGCHHLCDMLIAHNRTKNLYRVTVPHRMRKEFEKSGVLPDVLVSRLSLNANGRIVGHEAARSFLKQIDYVVLIRFFGEFGPALERHYSPKVNPKNVGVEFLFGPVDGAETIDVEAVTPDALAFYHRSRTWAVPLHPKNRPFESVMSYSERDHFLGSLFCPDPNGRIFRDCTVKSP